MAGETSLTPIELNALKDRVKGKSLLHLQCHFGQDTLSFARMGTRAVGMDLSPKAIEMAETLNEKLGLNARFVQSDLYGLPEVLDEKFDIVFTSYGVTTWLPDLQKWARVIQHFLNPNGLFYMAEFHPALYMYDHDRQQIGYRYFGHQKPYIETIKGTYADPDANIEHQELFWSHSLADTIQALLNVGLTLTKFEEYDFSPYNCFENMHAVAPGQYVFGDLVNRLPHVFAIEAKN